MKNEWVCVDQKLSNGEPVSIRFSTSVELRVDFMKKLLTDHVTMKKNHSQNVEKNRNYIYSKWVKYKPQWTGHSSKSAGLTIYELSLL